MMFPIPQVGYVNSRPPKHTAPSQKLRPYEPPFVREDSDGTFSIHIV